MLFENLYVEIGAPLFADDSNIMGRTKHDIGMFGQLTVNFEPLKNKHSELFRKLLGVASGLKVNQTIRLRISGHMQMFRSGSSWDNLSYPIHLMVENAQEDTIHVVSYVAE